MKKILVAFVLTVAIVGLVLLSRFHPASLTASLTSPTAASNKGVKFHYKDGSFTGQTVDVGYGPVQVRAIVSGGKIADIRFLQMPSDQGRSMEVTAMAEPILKRETLTAQSANVDIASGATQTSEGYIQSLQDALGQAKG